MRTSSARRGAAALAAAAVALGATGCGVLGGGDEPRRLTANFDRTVGLYVASDVRILGVRIGEVTSIEPAGDQVRVEMEYDPKYKLPEGAKAVVIAPSVVSDRYVQVTPAYVEGPVLPDGAVLAKDRTAVPVELDQIFSAVDELNLALGPNGANKDGALSDLLDVSAKNLDGNGKALGSTLRDFSTAVQTLSDQRGDLFGTITNLQDFTTTLARNDSTVRRFNADLASVADQLAGERQDLAQAIKSLSIALGEVAGFVRENEDSLTKNVSDLASITGVLVKQKAALEEFLDNSATALSNLQLAYNPNSGTLDTRANNFGAALPLTVCLVVLAPAANDAFPKDARDALLEQCEKALEGLDPGTIEQLLMNPDQLPDALRDKLEDLAGGLGGAQTRQRPAPRTDLTLSGYLGAQR